MSSLSKLREVLRSNEIADISRETLRKILKAEAVSWQATKTWKASADPEFAAKLNRILDLYDHPPADGRVVCVDEFGPLNMQPCPSRGWFPRRNPKRLRATYRTLIPGSPIHWGRATANTNYVAPSAWWSSAAARRI
ncbi:hypothetical protein [Nocardia sp. NPDC051463]|uniref:hypothetical protein n=1 Tax=Nocardia sp. NPDC051463 TaxID=3154845 RepID=UPI00344EFB9E